MNPKYEDRFEGIKLAERHIKHVIEKFSPEDMLTFDLTHSLHDIIKSAYTSFEEQTADLLLNLPEDTEEAEKGEVIKYRQS